MQSEDFHPVCAFGDCLRESPRFYDVSAVVNVAEDGAVAGEHALFLIVFVQVEKQGLVLGLSALLLNPAGKRSLPCGDAAFGGVVERRCFQVIQGQPCRVGCLVRAMSGRLKGHPCGQILGTYLFLCEVGPEAFCGLFGLLCGIFH